MGMLTVAKLRSISKPGRYGDGGTLFLNVSSTGSRSWIQRLTVNGRRHDIGLGGWPLVSLTEARDAAFENRRLVRRGGDPLAERRRARTPTFREAAQRTYETSLPRWRNAKVAANWWQQLERHAFKRLGAMPVDQIGRDDVLAVLTPLWTSKPETARRVRRTIKATLQWCQAHAHVEVNIAGECIDGALPAMPAVKRHHRALAYREVAAALETIATSRASLAAKLCLRFVVLTACRSGEARGATWSEILEAEKLWVVSADRMKSGTEWRQPLSDAAMAVLDQARALDDPSGLLFPSPVKRGSPLSDMSLTKVLRDTGLADRATVHGFRTSARTFWSERTNADHASMELCLAHAVGSQVERAYARSDLLKKRAVLMERWADFVAGGGDAKVVMLRTA